MESIEIVPSVPKYLEEQLDGIAKSHQLLEYTIHVDKGSKPGDGFMATMVSVILKGQQYHNDVKVNYELPLICKIIPDDIVRREVFSSGILFEREVYFYKTILPIFIQFLEEKNINVDNEFSFYPKCYIALVEPNLDHHLIVMENLKSLGYDLAKRIDFDAAGKVLSELAKFHSISFAMRDQRKEIFEKMFRIPEPFDDMFRGNGVAETMVSGAIQQTIDVLDDEKEIAVMQRVKDNYEIWLKEYLNSDTAGRFSVLNHGDLWNNNMMFDMQSNVSLQSMTKKFIHSFTYNELFQQPKLCFVDFQLLRLTSPVIDISYYLCTSTDSDVHQRFNELLHIYYNELSTFLTKLGSDPQKLFTFSDLEDQFRQFGKYGLIFAPILVGVMVSDSTDIIDMDSIKHDSKVEGLAKLNEKTKVLLKKRMSSVIQLAIKSGWL